MNIDYSLNLGKPSAAYLLAALQRIVDSHPEINFHQVGVSLNSGEYDFSRVQLLQWEHKGQTRFCIDID